RGLPVRELDLCLLAGAGEGAAWTTERRRRATDSACGRPRRPDHPLPAGAERRAADFGFGAFDPPWLRPHHIRHQRLRRRCHRGLLPRAHRPRQRDGLQQLSPTPCLLKTGLRGQAAPTATLALEKTSSPPFAPTSTMSPSTNLPSSICIASGSCTRRWIARFSGRAPYTGSQPRSASSSRAPSVTTSAIFRSVSRFSSRRS